MRTNFTSAITKTLTNRNKFDSLTVVENGLILKWHNKREIEIPYTELDKVYIKKYKLNPIVEFLCIAFPFLFVYIALQYLPFYFMIFVSMITVLPVFIRVLNYKWYQLFVILNDGTFFRKRVPLNKKIENFSIINRVEKDFFNYCKSSTLAKT